MRTFYSSVCLLSLLLIISQSYSQISKEDNKFPVLKGSYLGQKPPGMTPEIFAPGIVSTNHFELNSVFSSDGSIFLFAREISDDVVKMFSVKKNAGVWEKPKTVDFPKPYDNMDPLDMILSLDDKTLYFISSHPTSAFNDKSVNIWSSTWDGKNWLAPQILPSPVNSDSNEVYPFFVADGSMYLSSNRPGGFGDKDVYKIFNDNGSFTKTINLGPAVNTEFLEGDTYVSPDEKFLIVSSRGRPDSKGSTDLYISYKKPDGTWSNAENMGEPINSEHSDFCPMISPDEKYFFFSRNGDIYWVNAKVLDQYKPSTVTH